MLDDFEVVVSDEFLKKMEEEFELSMKTFGSKDAFTSYNRGGGPKGQYDRTYTKHTGR